MSPCESCKIGLVREKNMTLAACIWFLPNVSPCVFHKIVVTLAALVGFLTMQCESSYVWEVYHYF